jgi:DNA repair protein RecO
MHYIYHTHGFILSSKNTGEANKVFNIYTKELGLVRATAQGVRLHRSKLRFSLQDFSYIKVDLVRGKDIWRVTTASAVCSFPLARTKRESLIVIAQISKLLERLCHGEESNERIFTNLIQSLYLLDTEEIDSYSREALELYLVLNIMNALGYIGESKILNEYLGVDFSSLKIRSLLRDKKPIISYINKALNESQL